MGAYRCKNFLSEMMNEQQVLQEIIRRAECGDTEAMLFLAQLYLNGKGGMPKDDAMGCKWLEHVWG